MLAICKFFSCKIKISNPQKFIAHILIVLYSSNSSSVIKLSVYTVLIYQQCNNNDKHVYHNWILLTVDTVHTHTS